ncbi:hypothetical protein ABT120_36365 [Nonomuraea angiospora]|uniref:hypothetical protein n=1 Tax=Nonomuraea angiospora TaxID=46172 RepID=UPI003319491B
MALRTELKVVQRTLRPHLYHDSARMTARLVLKAVRVISRKVGKARAGTSQGR